MSVFIKLTTEEPLVMNCLQTRDVTVLKIITINLTPICPFLHVQTFKEYFTFLCKLSSVN